MTDADAHAEEQAMEVEALASILMDDMAVVTGAEAIEGATHAPCYQITISALGDGEEEDPNDESQTARLGLVFSHTPRYPDEPPLLKCRSVRGLFDSELVAAHALATTLARESLGAACVFDLVSALKEWMRDRAGVVDVVEETPEMLARRLEEEAEARLKAMRAVGTPVTRETYAAWSETFRAERELERLRAAAAERSDRDAAASAKDADEREKGQKEKKMTGRRYFEEKLAAQVEGELAREGRGHGDESLDEDDFDFASDDFDESEEEDDEILAFMRAKPSEAGGEEEGEEEEEEEEEEGGE